MDEEDIMNGLDLYKEKERDQMGAGETRYKPTDAVSYAFDYETGTEMTDSQIKEAKEQRTQYEQLIKQEMMNNDDWKDSATNDYGTAKPESLEEYLSCPKDS